MKALTRETFRRLIGFKVLLALALIAAGCTGGGQSPAESAGSSETSANESAESSGSTGGKEVVTMWGYSEPSEQLLEGFHKQYPDIDIQFVHTESADMMQKLQVSLASGSELPDFVMLERGFRGKAISLGVFEILEDAPYSADKSLMFDNSPITHSNAEGQLVSIPTDMSVAGLMYKRGLAKEYLGTDDPAELEQMMPTWEAMLAKGLEVKEKSGGKVFLFPSLWDLWSFLESQAQSKQPFVDGSKLNREQLVATYEQLIQFRDAGVVDKLTEWSPAWNAAFAQNNHIFSIGPVWAPSYLLENNDPDGKDAGRWGLITPPGGGVIMGGSGYGILKDADNKEAAWKFIQFAKLTQEGTVLEKSSGTFNHFKAAYDDPEFTKWEHAWFGGQDIGQKYFVDLISSANDYYLSEYEPIIRQANEVALKALNADPTLTVDGVMEKIVQHIQEIEPNIETE